MSLRIVCPRCGERPLEEFVYGEILTPPKDLDANEHDLDRAYMHSNPAGVTEERWFHAFGCRRWLTLRRDTTNDDITQQADST